MGKLEKAVCIVLIALFASFLWVGGSHAVTAQQEVEVAWVCQSQADVEAQIDTIIATKSTEQANELLKAKIATGDCAQSPIGPFAATVTKLGKSREAFEYKGVLILIVAVQVDDKFWTGSVEVIGKSS